MNEKLANFNQDLMEVDEEDELSETMGVDHRDWADYRFSNCSGVDFDLLIAAKKGDKKALNLLLLQNQGLCIHYAKSYAKYTPRDEAVQAAMIGYCTAVRKFDFSKNAKLSYYASYWMLSELNRKSNTNFDIKIPGHVRGILRRLKRSADFLQSGLSLAVYVDRNREELVKTITPEILDIVLHYSLGVKSLEVMNLNGTFKVSTPNRVESMLAQKQVMAKILEIVNNLNEKDRDFFVKKYLDEKSNVEIAEETGSTKEDVAQICQKTKLYIRRKLKGVSVEDIE